MLWLLTIDIKVQQHRHRSLMCGEFFRLESEEVSRQINNANLIPPFYWSMELPMWSKHFWLCHSNVLQSRSSGYFCIRREQREWKTWRCASGTALVFQASCPVWAHVFAFIGNNRDLGKTDHCAWLNKPARTFLTLASNLRTPAPPPLCSSFSLRRWISR